MIIYRRTQISWPTIVPLVAVAAVLIPIFISAHIDIAIWITVATYGIILLLFSTLTVTITSDGVLAVFGVGLLRKTLMFADITSFMPVRNTWLNGWGIHYFQGGVLWNASGLSAIEFKMANGRYVRIGTGEPDQLMIALTQAAGRPEVEHVAATGSLWARQQTAAAIIGVLGAAVAASTVYFGFQPPKTMVGFDAFYVSNGLYRNTIAYDAMQSLTLEETLPNVGVKTNGFAAGKTLRGNFRVDGWGPSRLFVNLDQPPFVVIKTADTHVVVNFADPLQTRRLYSELKPHVRNRR